MEKGQYMRHLCRSMAIKTNRVDIWYAFNESNANFYVTSRHVLTVLELAGHTYSLMVFPITFPRIYFFVCVCVSLLLMANAFDFILSQSIKKPLELLCEQ